MNYIIKRGDTLAKIATNFMNQSSNNYLSLAKINNIANPNRIYAGQSIYIPDTWLRKNTTDINKQNNITDINPFNNMVKKPAAWMTEALERSGNIYNRYSSGERPNLDMPNMVVGTKSGRLMTRESAISSGELPVENTFTSNTLFLIGLGMALFYMLMGDKRAPRARRRTTSKR